MPKRNNMLKVWLAGGGGARASPEHGILLLQKERKVVFTCRPVFLSSLIFPDFLAIT